MGPGDDELPGNWLRRLREAAGLTQEELAGRSGVSERAIRSLERGTRRPYPQSIRLVATALGLSSATTDDLITRYRTKGSTGQVWPAGSSLREAPAPAAVVHQLPATIPHFAGRAAELALLDRCLAQV